MKKYITSSPFSRRSFSHWLLAAVLIAGLLSGCARDENRIVVWHSLRPAEIAILQAQLQRFGARHPDWVFDEIFYAPETARTNFIISCLGGSGPALFWGASDNIGPFVELQVIQPMEPHLSENYLSQFIEDPFPANTWYRGHLYQVADRIGNHLCLVYNKALVPKPPETIRELIDMGRELTKDSDGDGKPDRYALAWNYTEPFFAIPFIGGYGGWILDANNRPTLDTEPVIKAAQLIYDLGHTYRIIPQECDYETANALFKEGLSAMIINGPWSFATYIDNEIDIGIARIPKIDATGLWPTPIVSPLGYSLNANLKGEKLAITIELLRFLTSPEVELEFTRTSSTIPSRKEAYESDIVRNNEILQSSYRQLIVGKLMPVIPEMRFIWDAMRPSYQAIFTGETTPEKAAKEMQKLALKLIRENE